MVALAGFIIVMIGLPLVLALLAKATEWYAVRRQSTLTSLFDLDAEETYGAFSASPRTSESSRRVSGFDSLRAPTAPGLRSGGATPRPLGASTFPSSTPAAADGADPLAKQRAAFTRVQLRLRDGVGHSFIVERKLGLN